MHDLLGTRCDPYVNRMLMSAHYDWLQYVCASRLAIRQGCTIRKTRKRKTKNYNA